jgi:murein DD-endopeptidase MepM/ murein hydrolase activator NlpD
MIDETTNQLSKILDDILFESERHNQQIRASIQQFQNVWLKMGGDVKPEPFWCSWPVGGPETPRVTDKFNAPRAYANRKHEGTDCDGYINLTGQLAPVLAAQDGVVEFVNMRTGESYGTHVVIRHPWGGDPVRYHTLYGHLSRVQVSVGQEVKRGEQIGVAGATGTQAVHLHFGVYDTVTGLKGYVRCSDCTALFTEGVIDPEIVLRS